MKEHEKARLRELVKCEHSKNGLFCELCKFDTAAFLKKWYKVDTSRL